MRKLTGMRRMEPWESAGLWRRSAAAAAPVAVESEAVEEEGFGRLRAAVILLLPLMAGFGEGI